MGAETGVELPTGVVTVLLADVEGSVRLWEADSEAMTRAMAELDGVVDTAVAAHGGVRPVEQGEGDSFVAAFARPADAVACAVAIQRAELGVRLRMAIHTDEAQLRGKGNYSGALVNRAARLRALAHGSQVLLSGATHELAAAALPERATVADLGVHQLRDLPAPVHVWQLLHPSLPDDFPPLRSPDALATNLPAQLTTFVGRTDELLTARKLLHENRLVTLIGPGGAGKTRLALELAADVFDAYPAGAWFVDLSPVADPTTVAPTIAVTLHVPDATTRTPLERVAGHFAGDRALLVLDNCEHVIGAVAAFVDGLLRACPRLDVVVTSREPLNVGGEAVYPVPPLDCPGDDLTVDATTLAQYDAVELFVDRAHLASPEFALDDDTTRLVASICHRVDGLPLAIELAAARIRVMSLGAVADSLARRFDVLAGGPRTGPMRQRSLADCVAWSHDLLDERERVLLRRLATFTASFGLDVVEAVCADDALPRAAVLDTLIGLVDKSLVAPAPGPQRYRLLATIREFARDRLADSPDDAGELRRRQLDFLIDLAERSEEGLAGPNHLAWIERFRAEVPDIEATLEWAADADRASALRLAAGLVTFSMLGGQVLRGWRWLEPLLDSAVEVDRTVRANACFGSGLLVLFCGEMAVAMQAPRLLGEALSLYEEAGDRLGIARVNGLQAIMMAMAGLPDAARAQWEDSVAALRQHGDTQWAAMLVVVWGARAVQVGRAHEGMPFLEEGLAVAAANGYATVETLAKGWLAAGHGMLGDHRRALELAEMALAEQRAVHDPDMGSFMLYVIGDAHYHLGDIDAAEVCGRESAAMGDRYHLPLHAALGHSLVGRIALDRGDAEEARVHFQTALDIATENGFGHFIPRHTSRLVAALIDLGRTDEARAALDRGLAAARGMPASIDLARLLLVGAGLDQAVGDDPAAEDAAHEALAMVVELGSLPLVISALEVLAGIAARQESDAEAVRLMAAASIVRDALGRREGDTDIIVAARERLGPEAFDAAWGEGAAMTAEEAAAYAARGRGARRRPTSGWSSLTPTEMDVVRLVAEGLTNPQIGERLFITRGTVRTHLSHVFAKLGVTSRSQLAAEATRRGVG